MATHCSIYAWRILWTRGLVGCSPRVAQSWARLSTHTHTGDLGGDPRKHQWGHKRGKERREHGVLDEQRILWVTRAPVTRTCRAVLVKGMGSGLFIPQSCFL